VATAGPASGFASRDGAGHPPDPPSTHRLIQTFRVSFSAAVGRRKLTIAGGGIDPFDTRWNRYDLAGSPVTMYFMGAPTAEFGDVRDTSFSNSSMKSNDPCPYGLLTLDGA